MAEPRLTGFKCKKCSWIAYPRRLICSSCRGKDFVEVPLGEEGRIVTFTRLWAIPEGVDRSPLTLAIVEFDHNVMVTGQVLSEEAKIGAKVRPVWGHLRKVRGKDVQGFRFQRLI